MVFPPLSLPVSRLDTLWTTVFSVLSYICLLVTEQSGPSLSHGRWMSAFLFLLLGLFVKVKHASLFTIYATHALQNIRTFPSVIYRVTFFLVNFIKYIAVRVQFRTNPHLVQWVLTGLVRGTPRSFSFQSIAFMCTLQQCHCFLHSFLPEHIR